MNRISAAIERQKANIKARLEAGTITQQKLDDAHKTLNMDLEEFVKFQEVKSLAFAMGKLNLEEAQLIYELLGNTCEHFNKQPIEVKFVLNGLLVELLKWKMAA